MNRIVVGALSFCLAASATAASVRVQPLPTLVAEAAGEPSVTVVDNQRFLLSWQARLPDNGAALRFRTVALDGAAAALGEVARGHGWFVNWADFPALAVLDNGDWLAHWLQRSGSARYAYDIRSTRSRDGGATWSTPVNLHDDGSRSEHGFVAYAPAGADAGIAVWLDGRHTAAAQRGAADDGHGGAHDHHGAGAMSLRAARLDAAGITAAVELDARVCDCCQTDSARSDAGTLVVYRDRSDEEIRDVSLIRHDGRRWLPAQPLFADGWRIAGCPVNGPAIAAHGSHVAAAAYSQAGDRASVRVRTSSDSGRHWGKPVVIAQEQTLGRLDLAALPDGRFLLSRLDGDDRVAHLRVVLLDRRGEPLATAQIASLPSNRLVGFPRLAVIGATALIAWTQPEDGQPRVQAALLHIVDAP